MHAQYGKQKKADAQFNSFAFVKAIDTYKKLIENEYNADYAKQRIGDAYGLLRKPEKAIKYYEEVVQQPNVDPEYFLKYAYALRGIKKYKESRDWLIRYKKVVKQVAPNIDKIIKSKDFITDTYKAKQRYKVTESPFNSSFSEFGAYIHDSVTYIASTRDDKGLIKRVYGWNMQPFLDIYRTEVDTTGLVTVAKIKGDINTKVHEGSMTISADGSTMYFTRTNYLNKKGKDEQGISNLKLYKAVLVDGKWTNIEELPFNSDTFSTGHPSLSRDGKTLYFVSDRMGGHGGSDLYKVTVLANGNYSEPMNLGREINTRGDEVFPFIHDNGTLFFSSDGHLGLGQLDIFATIVNRENKVVEILNLGVPINTSKDDFSFFLAEDGINGFIASNRAGGTGDDDIYAFQSIPQLRIKGQVTDLVNKQPLANAVIKVYNDKRELVSTITTDSQGYYQTEVDVDANYTLEASAEKYIAQKIELTTKRPETGNDIIVDFALEPIKNLEALADVDINKVYFDFDKYNIRRDSARELDKIIELMLKTYPKMVIAIGSHTDSRGADDYNLRLSNNRALATYRYLIQNGVPKQRIANYKGFGEMELITPCDDGQQCTEKEHELNRRSEFAVVKMD